MEVVAMEGNHELAQEIIGSAIEVHKELGPGLMESTYQTCLAHEFSLKGIGYEKEFPLPVEYKGTTLDCGYRIDFLVKNQIVLELKSIEKLLGVHEAQILTYMKLARVKQGFLINFNVKLLKNGLRSFML
jgi:GxxExxY protein